MAKDIAEALVNIGDIEMARADASPAGGKRVLSAQEKPFAAGPEGAGQPRFRAREIPMVDDSDITATVVPLPGLHPVVDRMNVHLTCGHFDHQVVLLIIVGYKVKSAGER